jgi:hypothetical protein
LATFDSSNDFMASALTAGALTLSGGVSLFVVGSRAGATGGDEWNFIYLGNDTTYATNYNWIGVGVQYNADTTPNAPFSGNFSGATERSLKGTPALVLNQRYALAAVVPASGGNNYIYANQTQSGTTTTATTITINSSGALTIGRRGNQAVGFLNGTISELLFFTNPFSTSQILKTNAFLQRKWNVS